MRFAVENGLLKRGPVAGLPGQSFVAVDPQHGSIEAMGFVFAALPLGLDWEFVFGLPDGGHPAVDHGGFFRVHGLLFLGAERNSVPEKRRLAF
ncbi:MAG TPA: hypothetical protein P5102_15245 [Candidatus Competibacteraceae bacterium]|nr:hypothetical protein [Candidatus Competibacteraceae bacterium]HRZ07469.1 hypothetical protein [Candidatus Competibacteraceae bacterium]HSA47838.1 hypothetical protein [Candidatus Competibacteraceae bacterium]